MDKGLNLLLNFRFLGFIKTQLAREPRIRKEMEEEIVCYRWFSREYWQRIQETSNSLSDRDYRRMNS